MHYANNEMKVRELIAQFNARQINLIPSFQRPSVWTIRMRRSLIENMVKGRPIPSLFFFKSPEDATTIYNILDGKQRLESLLLFIGRLHKTHKIPQVADYFHSASTRKHLNFAITFRGRKTTFAQLPDESVRKLMEYAISTIEVDLDTEEASMDDVVSLFIDINTKGVQVSRFQIAKSFRSDPLFRQVFDLLAAVHAPHKSQPATQIMKVKRSDFAAVLGKLSAVNRGQPDTTIKVDRMWERLTELALFARHKMHRMPADILKSMITQAKKRVPNPQLSIEDMRNLRAAFRYLRTAYREAPELQLTKFATEQPHFYTMITTLLSSDIMERFSSKQFGQRVAQFGKQLESPRKSRRAKEFLEQVAKATTHTEPRQRRQALLLGHLESD